MAKGLVAQISASGTAFAGNATRYSPVYSISTVPTESTESNAYSYYPIGGTITSIAVYVVSTTMTAGTITVSVNVNGSSTGSPSITINWNDTFPGWFTSTGGPISWSAGDTLNFKIVGSGGGGDTMTISRIEACLDTSTGDTVSGTLSQHSTTRTAPYTEYFSLCAASTATATSETATIQNKMPDAATLMYYRHRCTVFTGTGTVTVAARVNSSSVLSTTVSGTGWVGTATPATDNYAASEGDLVNFMTDDARGSGTFRSNWHIVTFKTTSKASLFFGNKDARNLTNNNLTGICGSLTDTSTESTFQLRSLFTSKARDMYCYIASYSGANNAGFAFRINGADSSPLLDAKGASATWFSDTSDQPTLASGDLICLRHIEESGVTATFGSVSLAIEDTTAAAATRRIYLIS